MSDYQKVKLLKKKGRVLTIEIEEDHPDVAALSSVLDKQGKFKRGSQTDAIKIAAILLFDEKGRSGDVSPPDDDEGPTPEQFVSAVAVAKAEVIGKDVNGDPRFRAVLDITVTEDRFAKVFKVNDTWGSVAELGTDFDDCFS